MTQDTKLENVIADLQQIELEEKQAKEFLEARQETEREQQALRYRQRKAIRVYEYSKIEPHYASKLASKWGRRKSEVNELKRLGQQLSDPSQGVTGVTRASLEGARQTVARMGQGLIGSGDNNMSVVLSPESKEYVRSICPQTQTRREKIESVKIDFERYVDNMKSRIDRDYLDLDIRSKLAELIETFWSTLNESLKNI